jgi:hypothetical protein
MIITLFFLEASMKIVIRITRTNKAEAYTEYTSTGVMPSIKTKTTFTTVDIPDDDDRFVFDSVSVEEQEK